MHEIYTWPWIEAQSERSIEAWRACALLPLPRGRHFSPRDQRRREKAYDQAARAIEREIGSAPIARSRRLAVQNRLAAVFPTFAAAALGLESKAIRLIADGFLPAGIEFARSARRFDAALGMAEIVQACRNAWTVCGLQPLLDERFRLTPSIVGYSLLYPYTDNYLDRTDASTSDKRRFCARFRQRLGGERPLALDAHEAATWALVEMIEDQYPRAAYPQVFDCLLAIHRAQEESIAQLGAGRDCSESEILRISFAKGGSSVLADACLVRGWLNSGESQSAFDWGALLQLGDDLQDVREDLRHGSATLFTRAIAEGEPLDCLVTQLLNFSEHVGGELDRFPGGTAVLKDLLRMSWRSVIIGAVANAREFFSASFVRRVECSSPFHFAFLEERQMKLTSQTDLHVRVFDALIETGEDEKSPPQSDHRSCALPAECLL